MKKELSLKLLSLKLKADELKESALQYTTKDKYLKELSKLFDETTIALDSNNKLSSKSSLDALDNKMKQAAEFLSKGVTDVAESLTKELSSQKEELLALTNKVINHFNTRCDNLHNVDNIANRIFYIKEATDILDLGTKSLLVADPKYDNHDELNKQRVLLQVYVNGMLQINDEVQNGDYMINARGDTIKLHFHETLQPGMAVVVHAVKK